jgi:RHS repeat-associated protein
VGRRTGVGGSLAQINAGAAVSTTSFNAANQLTTFGTQTLTYDANGNLTGDGTNTYIWDERNQLQSIAGGNTASFQYDALGRRIGKTIGTTSVGYLYDGINFVQEKSGTGSGAAVTANLVTGPGVDNVLARQTNAGNQTMLTDALGSVILATDATQATVSSYSYDAYGNTTQVGTNDNSQQYTGRENDATGLYYYRARYYSPAMGRFVSQDPIGWAAGQTNGYSYVGGDPLSYIDPTGLANSGVPTEVSGTTNTVRIDNPHVPGQQEHAHIYDKKGNLVTAINKDGTGSHGQCPDDLPKSKKLLNYLRLKGFNLGLVGDIIFLRDLVNNVGRVMDPMNPLFNPDINPEPEEI